MGAGCRRFESGRPDRITDGKRELTRGGGRRANPDANPNANPGGVGLGRLRARLGPAPLRQVVADPGANVDMDPADVEPQPA